MADQPLPTFLDANGNVIANLNPRDTPRAFDECQLGHWMLPGISVVEVSRGQKVDIKDADGNDGATETDKGVKPAPVKIKWRFWTREHWKDVPSILHYLSPTVGKVRGREPKTIVHPFTTMQRVQSVKILDVSGPKHIGKQIYEVDISAVEFFPPAKRKKAGAGGKGVTTTPGKADATSEKKVLDHVTGDAVGSGNGKNPADSLAKQLENATKYHNVDFGGG